MNYLVDTYNCIHAGRNLGGPFSRLTVGTLCRWIASSPRKPRVTLVLDGRKKPDEPDETEFSGIHFRYSGAGVSADLVIGQLVEVSTARKKLMVVTNDRAVALQARKNFASAISCESFLNELLQGQPGGGAGGKVISPQKSGGSSTPGETQHWLKEFGITPPDPAPLPIADAEEDDPDKMDIRKLLGDI